MTSRLKQIPGRGVAWNLVRRLAQAAIVSVIVVLITVLLIHLVPGDPARSILGTRASPERVAALREAMGLNQGLITATAQYLGNMLHGDLGHSLLQEGHSVAGILFPALGVTLALIAVTAVLSVLSGTATGLWAALSSHRGVDGLTGGMATLLLAMPPFFVGLLLLWVVALELGISPAGGWPGSWPENLRYIWLPSIALSAYLAPLVHRTVRGSAIETSEQDFIEAAFARGLPSRRLALRHVLPNSLLPVITLLALNLGTLVSGAVIVETVFDLPGLGAALVRAVAQRDYPVIQGAALISALAVVVGNLIADGLYAIVDPRTRGRG
jgi:peptide/nickel transport system permease protein